MRILVVGGTGILGRPAVRQLTAAGHEVVALSRRDATDESLRAVGAVPARFDLFDRDDVRRVADGSQAIVNLATRIPPPPGALLQRAWRENDRLRRDASRVLAEAAIAVGARFVQESFAPTYRDHATQWISEDAPLDPVAQTTTVLAAEASANLVTSRGGAGVVLRFGLFYGPETANWGEAAARGRLLLPGPGDRFSTLVFVDDAAAAVVAALELPAGCYNVVEDEPLTRDEHAGLLTSLVGRRVRPLPRVLGAVPTLRALARSHRISNARLRSASAWRPAVPSGRTGWELVVSGKDLPRP